MLGFLLVRQVGQALDELAALVSLYCQPASSCRPPGATARGGSPPTPVDVRRLLLAVVGALPARARLRQRPRRRRRPTRPPTSPSGAAPRSWPSPATPGRRTRRSTTRTTFAEDSGLLARFFTNPVALVGRSLFVLLALVGAREAFGAVAGGALSPGPEPRPRLVAAARRVAGTRSGRAPRSPRRRTSLPLALLRLARSAAPAPRSARCWCWPCRSRSGGPGGSCAWSGELVDARRRRPPGCSPGARSTYALIPVVSGAWGHGRFGVVAVGRAAAVAGPRRARLRRPGPRPPLAGGLAVRPAARARRGVRAGGVLVRRWCSRLVVVGAGFVISPRAMRDRSVWGPPAAALAVVRRCCSRPGGCPRCSTGPAAALLLDAGRLPMADGRLRATW